MKGRIDAMMVYKFRKAQRSAWKPVQRSWSYPCLERLEDRVVPSAPSDGTLLVATLPTTFAAHSTSFTGILGVDPNNGNQSIVSTGPFQLPTYVVEDPSTGKLFVADEDAFGTGAVFSVDPNLPSIANATRLASGTFFNKPDVLALVNGELYVANVGDGSSRVHYIVKVDPNTGTQLGIVSNGDNGTSTGGNTAITLNDTSNLDLASNNGNPPSPDPLKPWRSNQWAGWTVKILSGTGAGQFRTVSSNTSTQLTVSSSWTTIPDASSTYEIGFSVPTGMLPGPGNTVYLSDEPGNFSGPDQGSVWKVDLSTGVQTLVSTNSPTFGNLFNHSVDIAFDLSGNLIVANTGTPNGVFRVNPSTGAQSTIPNGTFSFIFTDSVEVGENGHIYVGIVENTTAEGSVYDVTASTTNSLDNNLSQVGGIRVYHAVQTAPAPTFTTLASSSNPSVVAQGVSFTAAVSSGAGTPMGSVQFVVDSRSFGSAVPVDSNGVTVSASTSSLAAGTHTVVANYIPQGNFQSSSDTLTQTVNASTTTTLSSSQNPATVGQSVTFTASVTANNGSIPTGSVQFAVDGSPLGSAVSLNGSGVAVSSPDSSLSAGPHTVTVSYSPSVNSFFLSSNDSLTQQVNNPTLIATTTALTPSGNPSVVGQGVSFTATVTASSGGPPTGSVQFVVDGRNFGSAISLNSSGVAVSTTASSLTAGTHTVVANYIPQGNFQSSSDTLTQTVNASTTTTLSSSQNPATVGQSVTFMATVTANNGSIPTGSVQFVVDGSPLGSAVSLNGSGVAVSSPDSGLSAGPHTVTATYSPTGFFVTSNDSLTQQVNAPTRTATTTAINSSGNPSAYGQSVIFTATVAPGSGSGMPSGSVQFVVDNGTPVTESLNGGGIATYSTNTLKVGTHTITANYTGDSTFGGSSSTALTQKVNQANTKTALTSSLNQPVFNQAVSFTAVVSVLSPGAGTPTGSIQFAIDNGTPVNVGLTSNGTATYTPSSLTAGTHTISASYTGDTNFLNSNSTALTQTINQANTNTTLTSSANPVVTGQTVTFTAVVNAAAPGSGTPTGSVQFVIDNGTPVTKSLNANGIATYSTNSLGLGTHTVMASYTGDTNFLGSPSTALTQMVNKQAPTTTTNVSSSASPSVFGQAASFTAMVSPQTGGGTPTGSVQFIIDNGSPVTMSLNGGTAIYSTASLGAGTHSITASYSGDGNFLPSSSNPFTQTVNPANTSMTVSSSPNPSSFGQAATLTASVSVQSPGAGAPTGTVQFQINGFNVGTPISLSSLGTASFTTPFFALNTQTVTAVYSGDNNFSASSGTLPGGQQVFFSLGLPSTTTVSSSNNPFLFGQNVTFTATVSGIFLPTGSVQFVIDGRNAGNPVRLTTFNGVTTGSYSTASLAVGTHSVQAVYSGDFNSGGSSGTLAGGQTVTSNSSTPTGTVLNSALSPSVFGQNVLFTATITANGGIGTPSGTVQFVIDGNPSGGPVSVSGSGGVATASFGATLTPGTHTITASYGGDASFLPSDGSFTQTVNQAHSPTVVSSSANPSGVGQTVSFTATISVQSPGGGTPTGTVQFQINGNPVGSPVNLSGSGGVATASFSAGFSAANSYTITANYSGDANLTSSSGTLTQTVQSGSSGTTNVTVTLDPTTRILSITGDNGNDAFTVTQGTPGVLQIAGVNTLINQSSSPATYALGAISQINISLLNGNNSVTLNNFQFAGTLAIAAGSGSDSVRLDTITASSLNLSLAGPAVDTVTLNNLTLGSATVAAGANAILALSGLNTAGTVALTAGSNATLSVNNLTAVGDLDVTVGDNTRAVTVTGSSVNTVSIRQTGSTGSPLFDLESDTLRNLFLQAGSGNNRLVFSHLQVAFELLVSLGLGNNTLSADHVTALFGILSANPSANNLYTNGGSNIGFIVLGFQQN
jgi:hypothetical protein